MCELAVDDVEIGPAHSTCVHCQQDLALAGLGVDELRRSQR
jgi:hypothetical protein